MQADRYLEAVDRCQHSFPQLRILTGVEYGQPHRCDDRVAGVVDLAALDRVNGSLHTIPFREDYAEPNTMYRHLPADEVIWFYLEKIPRMVAGSSSFSVFTRIDYAARSWPIATEGPFDPTHFEEGFRAALRSITQNDIMLELNTRRLEPWNPDGGRGGWPRSNLRERRTRTSPPRGQVPCGYAARGCERIPTGKASRGPLGPVGVSRHDGGHHHFHGNGLRPA